MKAFDLEAYLSGGVENVVKSIVKTSLFCPEEMSFMAKYAVSSRKSEARRRSYSEKGIHIPAFLIASITSFCNLHCAGCYARSLSACEDGEPVEQLSGEEWGRIFREARELGIGFILLAGGEPLVRRDVMEQAASVPEILFPVFTNGTLLQDKYMELLDRHRNLVPMLSIEGGPEQTDLRRGSGMYDRLTACMEGMKRRHIAFGASITVSRSNLREVTDPAYVEDLIHRGCRIVIYVEYVPVSPETESLAPNDEDRAVFEARLNQCREKYDDVFFIAFPGDEKSSEGCLAAGRGFFHINSHGGAEPCPFSPYSDVNIRGGSLLDAVQSPLFTALQSGELLKEEHEGGCVLFQRREQVAALLKDEMK